MAAITAQNKGILLRWGYRNSFRGIRSAIMRNNSLEGSRSFDIHKTWNLGSGGTALKWWDGTIYNLISTLASALTATRVPFVDSSGQLTDDADMTFATDTFTVTKAQVKAGNSSSNAKVGGATTDYSLDVSVGGAEADIYTKTLDASILNTNGDKIVVEYGGNFVTVGTELTQLKVYLAGTAIWDSTGVAPTTGTTSWIVNVLIIRVSPSVVRYNVKLTTTGASGFVYGKSGELTGLTLSNTNILKITGTSSGVGSGAGDIVGKLGSISFNPAA